MTIEFQPDRNSSKIYRPTPVELLTLGQTGDMESTLFIHARVEDADTLKLFLTGFAFNEPDIQSSDPNLRVLRGGDINKYQRRELEPLFLDYSLNLEVIKIMDRRFRWSHE